MEGVTGPLPASRPVPAVVQSAAKAAPAAPADPGPVHQFGSQPPLPEQLSTLVPPPPAVPYVAPPPGSP
eukprot:3078564-Alexandrium_andersonii.AAC.1